MFSGPLAQWYPLRRWGLGVGVALGLLLGASAEARQQGLQDPPIALAGLPAEARATHRLIQAAGPFVHPQDGAVFGNRERALPARARGFYREYTVPTPGAHDRGARRIVCGGHEPKTPDACYYTADHYTSFRRISP